MSNREGNGFVCSIKREASGEQEEVDFVCYVHYALAVLGSLVGTSSSPTLAKRSLAALETCHPPKAHVRIASPLYKALLGTCSPLYRTT